jgi:hypothetical protein
MTRFSIALCAVLLALPPLSFGQTPNHPPLSQRSVTKRGGFFDFVLDKINPNGVDYGICGASDRIPQPRFDAPRPTGAAIPPHTIKVVAVPRSATA